jgi:hypothetical protein
VAFFGTYPGGAGVFTQTSLIAKTGDTICGRTLLGVGQPAINSGGEVAFAGLFSDGSSAIIPGPPIIGSESEIRPHEILAPMNALFAGSKQFAAY